MTYCDGNPGHGDITVARAREDDRLMLYRHADGTNECYTETHKVAVNVRGLR